MQQQLPQQRPITAEVSFGSDAASQNTAPTSSEVELAAARQALDGYFNPKDNPKDATVTPAESAPAPLAPTITPAAPRRLKVVPEIHVSKPDQSEALQDAFNATSHVIALRQHFMATNASRGRHAA